MLNKDKILNSLVYLLFIIGFSCIIYVFYANWNRKKFDQMGELSCVTETYNVLNVDSHMDHLLKDKNQMVKILPKFYDCNPIQKNDLVYFKINDGIEPVVRIVRGLPGETYALTEDPAKKGNWNIIINDSSPDPSGTPYFITSNTVPALRTYELSRGGKLGDDEYILLSLIPPGLSDSSNLGLISKKNIIGKAVVIEK